MSAPNSSRRKWLLAGVVTVALFTIIGFLVLPPIVKAQAEKRLSAVLGRPVTIGKVRLNPYACSATIERFEVRDRDGGDFVGWDRLYVNFELRSFFTGEWILSDIELDGPHGRVVLNKDGSLNFSDLMAKAAAPSASPPPPSAPAGKKGPKPVVIERLAVNTARFEFVDRARSAPFATTLGPVGFSLAGFRTVGDPKAPYRFEAVTESGEKFSWSGTLSADPVKSAGEFAVENIVLKKYAPYLAPFTQLDVVDGKISVRGRYEADLTPGANVLRIADGAVALREVKVAERGDGQHVLELPQLDVTGLAADGVAMKASIARVAVEGGSAALRRETDGTLSVLRLLQPPAGATAVSSPAAAPVATKAKTPEITVGEIALSGFSVELEDRAAPRPAKLSLGAVQLGLKNFTLADGATMPVQLGFTWTPKGRVRLDGTLVLLPLKLDLAAEIADFALLPLSPYLEQFLNARITAGALSTKLKVALAAPAGQPSEIALSGDVRLENFGLVDSARAEELAGFKTLDLSGVKIATAPQLAVALAEVKLAAPYARLVVNPDQTLNLAALAKSAPGAPATIPAVPVQKPATPLPKIEIARVLISDGDFSFADQSITPGVRTALTQFGGTVAGLSSENLARGDVDLRGTMDGAGPIAITGKLDPLGANKFVDLVLDFKRVELLPMSPYSGKFAGYELARGKLGLDVKFKLEDRKISASNVVTLNQFRFGAATTSPDATKLPVRLGVALLQDADGKIVIDIPVEGSLDDPHFRIGRVVLRVIVNLLTKAAVSPFSMLGSMFGGGGDELAFGDFAPGSAALTPDTQKKLETLVKALSARPALGLGIEGNFDAAADGYVLKQQRLAQLVRAKIWETRRATNPDLPPPDKIEIAADEHAATLKKLFDEKWPPGAEMGAPLPPPPVPVAAPAPVARPGLLKRVVAAVTKLFEAKKSAPAPASPAVPPAVVSTTSAAAAGLSLDDMTARLAATMEISDSDLRALAAKRAQTVRDHFAGVGQIAPDRLFLTNASSTGDAAKTGKGPRVLLELQ